MTSKILKRDGSFVLKCLELKKIIIFSLLYNWGIAVGGFKSP